MDESKEVELEVRRALSAEVKAHREFLQSQFKHLTWGIGILFTVGAVVFVFLFGKSIEESKAQLISTVDSKVVDYRIVESFKNKLDVHIQTSVANALDDVNTRTLISNQIEIATSEAVSKVSSDAQDKLVEIVNQQVEAAKGYDTEELISKVSMPQGAVLAFNRGTCPVGWVKYLPVQGRTIVGAGKAEGLTERKFGESGGEEKHILTLGEMPAHSHSYSDWHYNDQKAAVGDYATKSGDDTGARVDIQRDSKAAGSSGAHNNMQPYYVLTYCEKA